MYLHWRESCSNHIPSSYTPDDRITPGFVLRCPLVTRPLKHKWHSRSTKLQWKAIIYIREHKNAIDTSGKGVLPSGSVGGSSCWSANHKETRHKCANTDKTCTLWIADQIQHGSYICNNNDNNSDCKPFSKHFHFAHVHARLNFK